MPYSNYNDKLEHNKTYYQRKKEGKTTDKSTAWIQRRLRNLIKLGIIIPEIDEQK